jgi:hypothetical protein
MSDFKIFLPITKIDVPKRLVYGTLASETADKAGERMHYGTSKPHFEKWTKEFEDATAHLGPEGRSAGNLRSMHKPKPAGKFTKLGFDDDGRKIDAVAKVTDDDEWRNCLEGVYTGFSIGGSYVGDLWKDADNPGVKWYTAAPVEGSLVDNPANPDAHFSLIKADGSIEERSFAAPITDVSGETELGWLRKIVERAFGKAASPAQIEPEVPPTPAKTACKAHGVVDCAKCAKAAEVEKREFSTKERTSAAGSGAALPDGSFPIENESDLRNAIHAYGRAKDKPKAKAHIISRAKALGRTDLIPEGWGKAAKGAIADLKKAAKDLSDIVSDKGKEARTMTIDIDDRFVQGFMGEVAKGTDPGDLLKRFSAGHRKAVTKAGTRHAKAMKSMKAGIKALGKAMEARVNKAAGEPDADDEAAAQMKKAADHFAESFRAHQKVTKSLAKAAQSWTGQAAESPGNVFSEMKPTSPAEMQGGAIPELDSTKPDPLLANKGAIPEFVSRHVAELMAKNAVLENQVEMMGRMPAAGSGSRPLTFGGAALLRGAGAGDDPVLANIRDADPNAPETINAVAAAFGKATADGMAKSVGDGNFRGGALNGGAAVARA